MVFPVIKLGMLALRTLSKAIASRLKQQAGLHPKFREFIISLAQVAGAAVIFEVQRNSKSEAKKEEKRMQELEAFRQRDEALSKEMEQLKHRMIELEKLAKGRGLTGFFNFRFFGQSGTEKTAEAA